MDNGFAKLEEKFKTYLKLYDIDYDAVIDYEIATVKINEQIDKSNYRIKCGQTALSNAQNAANSGARDTGRRIVIAQEAVSEAMAVKAQTDKEIAKYDKLREKIYNTSLKYPSLALEVAEQMVSEYPSNPMSYLYKAEYYRQQALWRFEMMKHGYVRAYDVDEAMNFDLDIVELVRNSVEDLSNVNAMKAELKIADKLLTDDVRAANSAFINELRNFASNYSKLIAKTNAELQRIEDEAGERFDAAEKVEKKKDFKKKLRNSIIMLVVLAIAGLALYLFVIRKML